MGSILGWAGKDAASAAGRGMSGIPGFVRQQEFSFLVAGHVPVKGPLQFSAQAQVPPPSPSPPPVTTQVTTETTNSTLTTSTNTDSVEASSSSSAPSAPTSGITYPQNTSSSTLCCGRPQWLTYRYFDFCRPNNDKRLGEAIIDTLAGANMPCDTPGCTLKRGEHETRIIHGGFRIVITSRDTEDFDTTTGGNQDEGERVIEMWESCKICEAKTEKNVMSDGT